MKIRPYMGFTLAILVFVGFVGLKSSVIAQTTHTIKAQTYAVEGTVGFQSQKIALDRLKTATRGELIVQLNGSNTVVNDFQMFEAVRKGVLDAMHLPGAFAASMDPGFAVIFSLPGLWDLPRDARIWIEGYGGKEILTKAYAKYGLQWVGTTMIAAEPIMSKFSIKTLADLKGKKIRTPAGITSMLFSELGAKPVPIPGAELYSAMQTGVVDACEFVTIAENFHARLHEVSKYILWPSFHGPIALVDWVVNKKVWDGLSQHLKEAFTLMVYEADYRYETMSSAADYKALEEMKKKGLTHTTLSGVEMEKARIISLKVANEYKVKSELSNEVITSVVSYLKSIGRLE
ncbi:MAG: TRAP transporter substrate-binding protein DctP [Candidatus Jordarchaeaceae archaeon]